MTIMRAKLSPAFHIAAALGLGLLATACGPIAFQDSIRFAAAPEPEPEPEPPPKRAHATLAGDRIELDDKIQFGYDSAVIERASYELLDDVVTLLKDNPEMSIDIVGHTSTEGSASHNKRLSTDRAAAVRTYLEEHGIDAARLSSQGKGEEEPIADEADEAGKEANRRVEFRVTKGKPARSGIRARPGS